MSNIKNPKKQKIRNNEYYDFQSIQDGLYAKSQQGKIFTDLMSVILSEANILLAYRNIKKNTGSRTAGTDGKTIDALALMMPDELVELVRRKVENFQPMMVRRVDIPKSDGRTRPLGIPTISDRLVQQCILQVMEPICEAKFYKHSYGFRPLRGAKDAIARAYRLAQRSHLHYVVDVDIKGFFDDIDHGKLIKQIWALGIRDKSLIAVISKLLKAKIEGIGVPERGTPQGGILSPLLANIVLNEFDHWVISQWEDMPTRTIYKGKDAKHNKVTHALKKTQLKEVYIVRYADDFKLFCRKHDHAARIFEASKRWLKERLKLEISPEKSKIINLRKEYSEFLGIKMKVAIKGKKRGSNERKWVVRSHTGNKAFEKIITMIRDHIKNIQKPKGKGEGAVRGYNSYVLGVHNYYNCATNVNMDFSKIAFRTRAILKNRAKPRRRKEKELLPKYIDLRYGASKQLRFVYDIPLIPVAYIKHQKIMLNKGYSPYVESDRQYVHAKQNAVSVDSLRYLIENPVKGESVEYNDNRLSLYVGQRGKCYVTGKMLDIQNMECHHKKPKSLGGSDAYSNLVLINENICRLIYISDIDTIVEYVLKLNLQVDTLEKVNKLKKLVNLPAIL